VLRRHVGGGFLQQPGHGAVGFAVAPGQDVVDRLEPRHRILRMRGNAYEHLHQRERVSQGRPVVVAGRCARRRAGQKARCEDGKRDGFHDVLLNQSITHAQHAAFTP
jgi:hypothetical protein